MIQIDLKNEMYDTNTLSHQLSIATTVLHNTVIAIACDSHVEAGVTYHRKALFAQSVFLSLKLFSYLIAITLRSGSSLL